MKKGDREQAYLEILDFLDRKYPKSKWSYLDEDLDEDLEEGLQTFKFICNGINLHLHHYSEWYEENSGHWEAQTFDPDTEEFYGEGSGVVKESVSSLTWQEAIQHELEYLEEFLYVRVRQDMEVIAHLTGRKI